MFNFWCECVQCLRGGVRFPNEVGVWWPSVYGGPNPKALHFQPWVGLGLRDRQALHRPHGSLAVHLKYKKTYLTRVFACVIVSSPTFAGSDRGVKLYIGGVTSRWGTFFLLAGFL